MWKYALLNLHLPKLNEVLSSMNKTRQIYNNNNSTVFTTNPKTYGKVKKEFGNSSDL